MKPRDIVKIYQDPITCRKLEGKAKLEEFISDENEYERWTVAFTDDGFKATRAVNKEKH